MATWRSTILAIIIVAGIYLGMFIALTALAGLILLFAWNISVVPLLHWPVMTFIIACGLVTLLSIIGSFFHRSKHE